jgi:2-dehydropantoate 2-reductase
MLARRTLVAPAHRSAVIAIVGSGPMALLLFSKFASAGACVHLVSTTASRADALSGSLLTVLDHRPSQDCSHHKCDQRVLHVTSSLKLPRFSEALRLLGFPLTGREPDEHTRAASSLSKQCDVVVLVGAAHQCPEATAAAALLVRDSNSIVLPLYNGGFSLDFVLHGLRTLTPVLREDLNSSAGCKVVYATTALGATVSADCATGATNLLHTGDGPTVLVPACNSVTSEDLLEVITMLRGAGLPRVSALHDIEDVHVVRWAKLAVNAVINPVTALFDLPNGDIVMALDDDKMLQHKVVNELIRDVSTAMLISNTPMSRLGSWTGWSNQTAEAILRTHVLAAAEATATNTSSTRRALADKRPSEVEFILGFVDRSWLRDDCLWYPPSSHAKSSHANASCMPRAFAASQDAISLTAHHEHHARRMSAPASYVSRMLIQVLRREVLLGCRAAPSVQADGKATGQINRDFWWRIREICKVGSPSAQP